MLRRSINPIRENSVSKPRNRAELRPSTKPAALIPEPCKTEELPTRKTPNAPVLPLKPSNALNPYINFPPAVIPSRDYLPPVPVAIAVLPQQNLLNTRTTDSLDGDDSNSEYSSVSSSDSVTVVQVPTGFNQFARLNNPSTSSIFVVEPTSITTATSADSGNNIIEAQMTNPFCLRPKS